MTIELPPYYFLYGEATKAADPDFIHVEDLAARSRPSGWKIAPHKHADINHMILISKGGGRIQYESDIIDFISPKLLVVPAHSVHGFEWQEDSEGMVLTIATVHLHHIFTDHPEFSAIFEHPRCIDIRPTERDAITANMTAISQELSWTALGQSAAQMAGLLMLMVHAGRSLQHVQNTNHGSQRQRNLVARYRQLLEQRYRLREPIEVYARHLAVSQTSLREACAAMGHSPIEMRDQRSMLEAQRLLAFSIMSVAEVGESIGIADPAYFSRFFTRHCGKSPARWRKENRQRRSNP